MALPIFQDPSQSLMLLQTKWASEINPALANPILNGLQLKGISLSAGANVIPHKLQRQMQGWFITDLNAAVIPYRSSPMNQTSLTLTVSAPVIVNIWVY